ncbi:4'-phosphopantetheinyl transferase superfamily protein [uncultured Bacteroides sp.]|uniref:4'-phosphopantetheinyl transferase family protein n=1 Tax=uncultured Bacteroides sp. TaxID=162156 RepID=UPI002AABA781|nr:4'-phosphopantetheinyl transferase superfamily protein [uncultured Bacteroides sp.]
MAVLEKHIDVNCRWGIWKMEETIEHLLLLFSDPAQQLEQMQHLTAQCRRLEWLSVRALLKELCGEEKQIKYLSTGMPYLSDHSFHISISHTRGYVAVILSTQKKVGIDIEQYGERILKLRTKFMSKQEIETISADKEVYHLLLHWSAKETLFKIIGEEAVDFKEHLLISPFIPEKKGTFNAYELRTAKQQKFLLHYQIHPDFVITWC